MAPAGQQGRLDEFRIYRLLGEKRRREEALNLGRWEDDGGSVKPGVSTCAGCGATEADPACYCGC